MHQSQAQFNTYVKEGTVLNNYAHIFDILIRLRQVRHNALLNALSLLPLLHCLSSSMFLFRLDYIFDFYFPLF